MGPALGPRLIYRLRVRRGSQGRMQRLRKDHSDLLAGEEDHFLVGCIAKVRISSGVSIIMEPVPANGHPGREHRRHYVNPVEKRPHRKP